MQTNATLSSPAGRAGLTPTLEFLTFTLGGEEYGIDIQKVQELRGCDAVTRIAAAPEWLSGVINLRGAIVPIVDLRVKFNLASGNCKAFAVVIIVNVGRRVIGMVVDNVSDVITLERHQVKPAPQVGAALDTSYLIGIGTLDARLLILVDIEQLMSDADMGLAERLVA